MLSEIFIDGSEGEGGGQMLRTSLALSLLTRKTFRMINIRARRKNPGLAPQHLQSIQAAATISDSRVEGARLGSQEILFIPGEIRRSDYHFEIGTAGSTSLVFQTICYPLSRKGAGSRVRIRGGTHVSGAPCFDYLARQWLPWVKRMGYEFQLEMHRAGYYPKGGGEISAVCGVHHQAPALEMTDRGKLIELQLYTGYTGVPSSVAERASRAASEILKKRNFSFSINTQRIEGFGSGFYTLVHAQYEKGGCLYFALSERGVPAEETGRQAAEHFLFYADHNGAVDEYLSDQLLIPGVLNKEPTSYTTPMVTQHLMTNRDILLKFLEREIHIAGNIGEPGRISIL